MSVDNIRNNPRWTAEEEEKLCRAVSAYSDWDEVPYASIQDKYFPHRSVSALQAKYLRTKDKYSFYQWSDNASKNVFRMYLDGASIGQIHTKMIEVGLTGASPRDIELEIERLRGILSSKVRTYAEEHGLRPTKRYSLEQLQAFAKFKAPEGNSFAAKAAIAALHEIING